MILRMPRNSPNWETIIEKDSQLHGLVILTGDLYTRDLLAQNYRAKINLSL